VAQQNVSGDSFRDGKAVGVLLMFEDHKEKKNVQKNFRNGGINA
jgi:hypothetical protein